MTQRQLPWPAAGRIPRVLLAVSVTLGLVLLAEVANQIARLGTPSTVSGGELPWAYIVSFLLSLPFILGIAYGGAYLSREPLPAERNHRILKWCLGGMGVWLVINLLTMVSFGFFSFWPAVGWVRGALAWGGAFGLLVGVVEARAITSAVATEQAQLRAERLVEQQDAADYLNSMLRHEVLNSAAVIRGRAEILDREGDTAEAGEHVEPILRRSADIEEFVQQSRQLMESMYAEPDFESVDLSKLLHAEATAARELNASAEVVIETQSALPVEGDAMLSGVFGNLLSNAVEHNDSELPRVTVTATTTDEEVHVVVEDNGSGIDAETRATLFERPETSTGDHGFGLYIVSRLCERYGGTVSLVETGPAGTTFRVTLPRANTDSDPETESVAESGVCA